MPRQPSWLVAALPVLLRWLALTAAIGLTASVEDRLAQQVGWPPTTAWMLPVAIDVYAIAAFRARRDIAAALTLMITANVLYHLTAAAILPTTWWSVVTVSALPPLIVWRVHELAHDARPPTQEMLYKARPTPPPTGVRHEWGRRQGPELAPDSQEPLARGSGTVPVVSRAPTPQGPDPDPPISTAGRPNAPTAGPSATIPALNGHHVLHHNGPLPTSLPHTSSPSRVPRADRVAEVERLRAAGEDTRDTVLAARWGITDRAARKVLADPRLKPTRRSRSAGEGHDGLQQKG